MAAVEHIPVIHELPEAPDSSFFSPTQWEVLFGLMDGIMPPIVAASDAQPSTQQSTELVIGDKDFDKLIDRASTYVVNSPGRAELERFFKSRPTDSPEFRDDVIRTLSVAPQKVDLGRVLSIINTRLGSLLLTGYWTPVLQQPPYVREAIIKGWKHSRIELLNVLAKSVATIALKAFTMTSPLLQEFSGYTNVPKDWKKIDGYNYTFRQAPPGDGVHVVETDVVIVGSGCGGGVAAKNIAEAGLKVMVVDKGYYFPPSHLPMTQSAAGQYLYDHGGIYLSEDGGAGVVAGSTWGGGGTVNWSVCLRLQDFVRKEWAEEGLPLFESKDFDDCIDRVSEFAGVGTKAIRQNHRNKMILEGSEKLGWKAYAAPQNTADKEHYCGHCHLGCGSAEKRGPATSWLPAAGEAGAEFMEGFRVEKVVFGDDGKTAIGVEGLWTGRDADGNVHTPVSERTTRKVFIKAKRVVVSCGSLWSPLVLMRSGIQNRQLGKNLHLHPCNFVSSIHEEHVNPWEGGIITSLSTEFENQDEKGHGVKLEPTCMIPYSILALSPFVDSIQTKMSMLQFSHQNGFIALTRDRDSGRVFPDPEHGGPRIDYTASDFDRAHTLEGVIGISKLAYVSGATEIKPHLPALDPFVPSDGGKAQRSHPVGKDPEFTDPAFAKWVKALRAAGNKPPVAFWSSAHQMGTCRMAANPEKGVVDGTGKVWGKEGLYVSDASVFPSASGVNPMLTVLSISDWISRGIVKDLKGKA